MPYISTTKFRKLLEVEKLLNMDEKSFSASFSGHTIVNDRTGEIVEATDFIREQTRLWRETWILPVLKSVLNSFKC